MRRSIGVGADGPDFYPRARCGRRSTRSTSASTRPSTTASTRPASRAPQEAYEEAARALFATLDDLEALLGAQRYLAGDRITEADWRLFTTLVRFDPVYVGHFKCNLRRLVDYPNLWAYARELYQVPGVAGTVDFHHIKQHYYGSMETGESDRHRADRAGDRLERAARQGLSRATSQSRRFHGKNAAGV